MALFGYSMGERVSRGRGQSAVRTAAYLARDCYEDQRTGWVHDFRKSPIMEAADHIARAGRHAELGSRQEVLFLGLYAPEGAPDWCRGAENIERFWNAAEAAEKHGRAQVAERVIIALPHEFTLEHARWALQDHIREFTRQGRVVQLAIHSAEPGHDARNLHAHLLVSLRGVDENGLKPRKAQEQQERYLYRSQYVEHLRENWAHVVNRHLRRHGFEGALDHRSFLRRGLDIEAEAHMGPGDAQRERKGERTEVGDYNRGVRERNAERPRLREREALDQAAHVRHSGGEKREETGERLQPGQKFRQTSRPREDLDQAALLDRVPSGWRPLSVEDVAAELSRAYAEARAHVRDRAGAVEKARRAVDRAEQDQAVALYRMTERQREIGVVRQVLHDSSKWRPDMGFIRRMAYRLLGDGELDKWEASYRSAGKRVVKSKAELNAVEAEHTAWERRAAAALQTIRPEAQGELSRRQSVAQDARRQLEREHTHEHRPRLRQ
jgi:hypothetical protein